MNKTIEDFESIIWDIDYATELYYYKIRSRAEFRDKLWKQRFEELNGFPIEESFKKENIIMPFSENDYLENKVIE